LVHTAIGIQRSFGVPETEDSQRCECESKRRSQVQEEPKRGDGICSLIYRSPEMTGRSRLWR